MTQYNEIFSYEISDNSYEIYFNDKSWIVQQGIFAKLYNSEGTIEENCLLHLESLATTMLQEENNTTPTYQEGYEQAILDLVEIEEVPLAHDEEDGE